MIYWERLNSKDLLELYDGKLEALWLQPVLYFFFKRDIQDVREENRKFHLSLSKMTTDEFLDTPILNLIRRGFKI